MLSQRDTKNPRILETLWEAEPARGLQKIRQSLSVHDHLQYSRRQAVLKTSNLFAGEETLLVSSL